MNIAVVIIKRRRGHHTYIRVLLQHLGITTPHGLNN